MIASPCISVCRMDADGVLCQGCLRSLDEIAAWSRLGDAARIEILDRVAERRRNHPLPTAALAAKRQAHD